VSGSGPRHWSSFKPSSSSSHVNLMVLPIGSRSRMPPTCSCSNYGRLSELRIMFKIQRTHHAKSEINKCLLRVPGIRHELCCEVTIISINGRDVHRLIPFILFVR
jgi:hypothetical protein